MPNVEVLDLTGKKVKTIDLNENIFGIEPNQQVVYDVVNAQRAAMRQGTHKVKTRSEVRGGGKKPWRQKGTGRARQGTTRAPQWVGGGIVFGPTPRSYRVKVNKKVKQLALKSVLSSKVKANEFKVVDNFNLTEIKTKTMVTAINSLSTTKRNIILTDNVNELVVKSSRNIPGVVVTTVEQASVYELMRAGNIILTEAAVKKYEEVLS